MWFTRKRRSAPAPTAREAAGPAAQRPPNPGALPRSTAILTGLGGVTVAAFGLWALQSIVAPVFLALVLTICVHPLRRSLERHGVPRGVSTGLVVTTVFVLLASFVTALVVALAQFVTLLPQFGPQLQAIGDRVGEALAGIGIGQDQVHAIVSGFDPSRLVDLVTGLFGGVANITVGLIVVLTTLILMAVDASALSTVFAQLRPTRARIVTSAERFASGVRRYMVATTVLGVLQGALNGLALVILGVPGAFLWGLLSFLCSFIPNIGYFIAIIPPVIFGFLLGGWGLAIPVLIVYAVINALVQTLLQPRVVGNAVALSQTITFVSVLVWAVVVGPIGAILAIPLTLLVRTVLIDADPRAWWWRPVLGDLRETRQLMKSEDEEYRATRRTARLERKQRGR